MEQAVIELSFVIGQRPACLHMGYPRASLARHRNDTAAADEEPSADAVVPAETHVAYAFYENNPSGTMAQDLIILSAGPLASLLFGVLLYLWYRLGKAGYGFGRLVLFWLAWLGILMFVNYLMVTPFLSTGDTAQIADRLGWPAWPRFVVSALAIVCVVLLARAVAESMFQLAPALAFPTPRSRRRFILGGFYLPLIAGMVLTALAGIGGKPLNIGLGLLGMFGNIDIVVAALYAARAEVGLKRPARRRCRLESSLPQSDSISRSCWCTCLSSHAECRSSSK